MVEVTRTRTGLDATPRLWVDAVSTLLLAAGAAFQPKPGCNQACAGQLALRPHVW